MTNDTGEKRRFSRIPFDAEVDLIGPARRWRSRLIDVSLKGVLMERPADWNGAVDERFDLEILLGEPVGIVIGMTAEVAHLGADSIGLRCLHIDTGSATHLRRLMELNLGDATLVDRELSVLGPGSQD